MSNEHQLINRVFQVLAALLISANSCAQDIYPSKLIRLIVPYATGGTGATIAQLIAPKWGAILGQNIVLDYRPGAGSNIGLDALAKSAPDGYTIGLWDNAMVMNPSLYSSLPYNFKVDLKPIMYVSAAPLVLVVNPGVPVENVKDLVALARSKPGQLSYASAGQGTPVHIAAEMLNSYAKIEVVHIPYKGGGPAITDVLGGQVPMLFAAVGTALPYIKSGKLKPIAVTGAQRFKGLPNVPTLSEEGIAGIDMAVTVGFLAPARTPDEVLTRLHKALYEAVTSPEIIARMGDLGHVPVLADTNAAMDLLKKEEQAAARIIKSAGIKLD